MVLYNTLTSQALNREKNSNFLIHIFTFFVAICRNLGVFGGKFFVPNFPLVKCMNTILYHNYRLFDKEYNPSHFVPFSFNIARSRVSRHFVICRAYNE